MKRRLKLLVLSLVLMTTATIAQGLAFQDKEVSPEARQRYEQARKLLARGEKEKALEELKAIILLAPLFVEAQRDFLDNQRDKAATFVEEYEGYVKKNPDSAVYHYLLGKVYSNANQVEKADAEFQKALELDPEFGWAMLAASTTATRNGKSDRAIELLEKASTRAGESVPLRSALANSFINKKRYDQALREADRILQIDPDQFDAIRIKWQARLSLTFGADETRAEVLREIQELEARRGKEIPALLVVQSGYQMLENEAGAESARKAILALDPKYYERQPFNFGIGTSSGKFVRLSGPIARSFSQTYSMKDERKKIEVFERLEKEIEDPDARLYALYPAMLRSYIAVKDLENARRTVDKMVKGNADPADLSTNRITLARALVESKTDLDGALNFARLAVEQLRQPSPVKEGTSPEASEYQKENARKQLAIALHIQGQVLLAKGQPQQAAEPLKESVQLAASEDSLFDLGAAYTKLGRKAEAVEVLSEAYAYEGKRQQEARASIQKLYNSKGKPLGEYLKEAVERHREKVRAAALEKALREIAKTERKEAPAFELITLGGQRVQLADLRGKVLLLNFWATW